MGPRLDTAGGPARILAVAATVLLGALVLSACGGGAHPAQAVTTSTSASPKATTTTVATPSSTTVPPSTTAAAPTSCRTSALRVEVGRIQNAGTGHFGTVVALVNTSPTITCIIDGYLGLQLLSRTGRPLPTQVVTGSGYIFTDGGPGNVLVGPGQAASAGVEWEDVPTPADPPGGCRSSGYLRVTPPGATGDLVVAATITACSGGTLRTTGLVAGSTGPAS